MTTRVIFQQELKDLRQSVAEMGRQIGENYTGLFQAIQSNDRKTMIWLLKNDRNINDMKRSIEGQCLHLITKQQPVAGDLRVISACLKVVTDMERVGDHVSDIAEILLRFEHQDFSTISSHMESMIEETGKLLKQAIQAFVEQKKDQAKELIPGDDRIDDLFAQVKDDIVRTLRSVNANCDECIDLLMIAKYLERIGDHAVNICEWESFQESGTIDHIRLL